MIFHKTLRTLETIINITVNIQNNNLYTFRFDVAAVKPLFETVKIVRVFPLGLVIHTPAQILNMLSPITSISFTKS